MHDFALEKFVCGRMYPVLSDMYVHTLNVTQTYIVRTNYDKITYINITIISQKGKRF
jgi:hypothetical protein